jgi:glycosyltransferase involved in cell wall biosynthesis
LKKRLYQKNDIYVVGCSKWITSAAKESPLFQGADIRYIYNGVDTAIFDSSRGNLRKELAIEDNEFVMITMANKWFDKMNDRICKKIIANMKKNDCLIIVGCKDKQKADLTQVNSKGKIIAMDYICERERLASIYNTGNLFINLTHVDTLPTVNMEAASCGLPVITYRSGGSGELVDEGVTGYVIDDFDDDAAVLYAIEQVKSGKISGKSCREKALDSFDKCYNYEKYIKLYEEMG